MIPVLFIDNLAGIFFIEGLEQVFLCEKHLAALLSIEGLEMVLQK